MTQAEQGDHVSEVLQLMFHTTKPGVKRSTAGLAVPAAVEIPPAPSQTEAEKSSLSEKNSDRTGAASFTSWIGRLFTTSRNGSPSVQKPAASTLATPAVPLRPVVEKGAPEGAGTSVAGRSSDAFDWRLMPPCPVAGYRLDHDGLYDTTRNGRQSSAPITTEALRQLILEASSLETRSKFEIDSSFVRHIKSRSTSGGGYVLSPVFAGFGAFLLAYKFPRVFRETPARDSVLLKQEWFRTRIFGPDAAMTATMPRDVLLRIEGFARRYDKWLRLTNLRCMGTLAAGVVLSVVGYGTSDTAERALNENMDAKLGREQAAFHLHTQAALQWMWTVYYHHPTYQGGAPLIDLSFIPTPPSSSSSAHRSFR